MCSGTDRLSKFLSCATTYQIGKYLNTVICGIFCLVSRNFGEISQVAAHSVIWSTS